MIVVSFHAPHAAFQDKLCICCINCATPNPKPELARACWSFAKGEDKFLFILRDSFFDSAPFLTSFGHALRVRRLGRFTV